MKVFAAVLLIVASANAGFLSSPIAYTSYAVPAATSYQYQYRYAPTVQYVAAAPVIQKYAVAAPVVQKVAVAPVVQKVVQTEPVVAKVVSQPVVQIAQPVVKTLVAQPVVKTIAAAPLISTYPAYASYGYGYAPYASYYGNYLLKK